MGEKTKDIRKIFKKNALLLIILEGFFIAFSIILYQLKDYNLGIENFSTEKLSFFLAIWTSFFGIIVIIFLIDGIFRHEFLEIGFAKRFNYRNIFIVLIILMIFGASAFFLQLIIMGGNLNSLTWGSFILGTIGIIILSIVSFIGIFQIIVEVRTQLR